MKKILSTATALLIVLTVSAFTFIFSSCKTTPSETTVITTSSVITEYKRPGIDFSQLEYERPDFAELSEKIEYAKSLISSPDKRNELEDTFAEIETLYNNINTQYGLLNVKQSLDLSDETIEDELLVFTEQITKSEDALYDLIYTFLNSQYKEELLEDWTEDDINYAIMKHNMTDDEYITLSKRETELLNNYKTTVKNIKLPLNNGYEISIDDLSGLYYSGTIDYTTYLSLYNQYLEDVSSAVLPIYTELIGIFNRYSEKAGTADYTEYCYKYVYDRDFTAENAQALCDAVKKYIVPLYNRLSDSLSDNERNYLTNILGETNVDLKDYEQNYISYFTEISDDMVDAYNYMYKYNLCDIGAGDTKENGSFATYFSSWDIPFLYQYTNNSVFDVSTFIHEFGHFYTFYQNGENTRFYIDINEIQSQAGEWLFLEKYGFLPNALKAFTKYQLLDTLEILIQGCMFDEFQRIVYSRKDSNIDFGNILGKLAEDYGKTSDNYDWSNIWALIPHNFENPLYYISYATSAVPSLEIFFESLTDRNSALEMYRNIVDMSDGYKFLECLNENGFKSPFEESTIKYIADTITQKYINK